MWWEVFPRVYKRLLLTIVMGGVLKVMGGGSLFDGRCVQGNDGRGSQGDWKGSLSDWRGSQGDARGSQGDGRGSKI